LGEFRRLIQSVKRGAGVVGLIFAGEKHDLVCEFTPAELTRVVGMLIMSVPIKTIVCGELLFVDLVSTRFLNIEKI